MKKHTLFLTIASMMFCLPQTASPWGDKEPTAIVIDAETGKPIEGAVALAQWHRYGGGAMFEGGIDVLVKAKEAFSDKDGKVDIDGFWGLYVFSREPRLTVYKPGYVIWDSKEICPIFEKRKDFDEKHRTVKLMRFETEAARWIKEHYDVGRGGPREMQRFFFSSCYDSTMGNKYTVKEITIRDIFQKYERPYLDEEVNEKKRRETK